LYQQLNFPIARDRPSAYNFPSSVRTRTGSILADKARILVVDDNPDVLSAARLLLKQHYSDIQTLADPGPLPELAA